MYFDPSLQLPVKDEVTGLTIPRYVHDDNEMVEYFREGWKNRDIAQCLCTMQSHHGLRFLFDFKNFHAIHDNGLLETVAFETYISADNTPLCSVSLLRFMFMSCDKEKLRKCGDDFPSSGVIKLYRGVSGNGRSRRVRGFSWTSDLEKAKWFALWRQQAMPAVFAVDMPVENILLCYNGRNEHEYVCLLPEHLKPKRVWRGEDA